MAAPGKGVARRYLLQGKHSASSNILAHQSVASSSLQSLVALNWRHCCDPFLANLFDMILELSQVVGAVRGRISGSHVSLMTFAFCISSYESHFAEASDFDEQSSPLSPIVPPDVARWYMPAMFFFWGVFCKTPSPREYLGRRKASRRSRKLKRRMSWRCRSGNPDRVNSWARYLSFQLSGKVCAWAWFRVRRSFVPAFDAILTCLWHSPCLQSLTQRCLNVCSNCGVNPHFFIRNLASCRFFPSALEVHNLDIEAAFPSVAHQWLFVGPHCYEGAPLRTAREM